MNANDQLPDFIPESLDPERILKEKEKNIAAQKIERKKEARTYDKEARVFLASCCFLAVIYIWNSWPFGEISFYGAMAFFVSMFLRSVIK